MCLLGLLLRPDDDVSLLLVHSRDEFFDRPAEGPDPDSRDGIVCPLDVRSGGTWMGVSRAGNFTVALTNASRPLQTPPSYLSRGVLVADVLAGRRPALSPARLLAACEAGGAAARVALDAPVAGFNLIVALHAPEAASAVFYITNRPRQSLVDAVQPGADREGLVLRVDASGLCELAADAAVAVRVEPGAHALSNSSLDDGSWAKVVWLRTKLAALTVAPQSSPPPAASAGCAVVSGSCGAPTADMATLCALLSEVVPLLTHAAPLDSAVTMPDVGWSPLLPAFERYLQDHAFVPPLAGTRYGTREIALTARVRSTTFFVFRAFGEEEEAAPPTTAPTSASACTIELGGRPWLVVRC